MATWYVDNLLGNDANAGTSPGAGNAFATLNKFNSLATLAAGDIIRVKSTGTNYPITNPGGSTGVNFFSTNGGTTTRSIYITNYTTDTTRPTLSFTKDLVNTNGFWNYNAARTKNINFLIDSLTDTTGFLNVVDFISIAGSTSNTVIESCNFTYARTGAGSNPNKAISFAYSSMKNCEFDFALGNYMFNSINQVTQTTYNNIFKGIRSTGSSVFNIYGSVIKNIFYDNTTSATNGVIFLSNTSTSYITFNNNTVIINDDAAMSSNTMFMFTRFGNATQLATIGYSNFSNVWINNRTVGNTYMIGGATNITPPAEIQAKVGNDALSNFTNISSNITYTNFPTNSDLFQFGAFITLSGNPFLSQTPGNANFCKIDSSITAGQQLMGVAVYDPEIDLGAYQTIAGAGSAPNAYDLRSGVTVGAVTGTLVIPAITDVRSGINYDVAPNAKVGSLDLPSEDDVRFGTTYDNSTKTGLLDLPSEADVKLGVGYDQSSKVGSLESTDPGISNVKTGTSYKINSVTYNGTYTAYALLALANVKFGIDRGDGQLGTDVGADFNNDPLESNVKNGVTYKIANVNKVGSHVEAISTNPGESNVRDGIEYTINDVDYTGSYVAYPLLPANNVESGVDRGDGSLGTNKGENFNTVLTPDQIAIGESVENLGETVNGTYDANERYSDLQPEVVQLGLEYIYNNDPRTGTSAGGASDYPSEDNVLFPVEYAYGTKQGKLGTYNLSILDVASQINENARLVIANILGNEFEQLRYFKDVSKNDFNNNKGYGIRPLGDVRTFDVIGKETIDLDFEIKLATYFDNREGDEAERLAELYLIQKTEQIRRQLRITKMGYTPQVRVVKAFDRDEVEKVDGQFVIVCRTVITVSYGIN